MTVLLHHSADLPPAGSYQSWFAVTGTTTSLPKDSKLPRLAARLEEAFNESRETWWRLGLKMFEAPGADFAYAPTGAVFGSDFGIMLAWSRLCAELAEGEIKVLVVCDDPWLFRHLAHLPGVEAASAPGLFRRRLVLWGRGYLSRLKTSLRVALAALRLRGQRKILPGGEPVLLVYGHPQSNAKGWDAYFGDLMTNIPASRRLLHTDCPAGRALELSADGRTASLHAWGCPLFALSLFRITWRPLKAHLQGEFGWLIRRAAKIENSGGGLAMSRWQMHCQRRWLKAAKACSVVWPWENFNWERDLCRAARRLGVATYGYQHTAIGPHQLNYSPRTNRDGLHSIPDRIIANGPAYGDEMIEWDFPEERVVIGGAFRLNRPQTDIYNKNGPIFVPLSAHRATAASQVIAGKILASDGQKVLIKEHPMYPVDFDETDNLKRTQISLFEQSSVSLVLYCTGTVGLEAALAGLPALRLMLDDRIAIDFLPKGITVPKTTLDDLANAIATAPPTVEVNWEDIIGDVDPDFWVDLLTENTQKKAVN